MIRYSTQLQNVDEDVAFGVRRSVMMVGEEMITGESGFFLVRDIGDDLMSFIRRFLVPEAAFCFGVSFEFVLDDGDADRGLCETRLREL